MEFVILFDFIYNCERENNKYFIELENKFNPRSFIHLFYCL